MTATPMMRARPAQRARSGWWRSPRRREDLLFAVLFLLPSLLLFGTFVYYALGFNVYLSFTSWNFIAPVKTWVGFDNYARLLTSARFWKVFTNTFYFALGTVTLSMLGGLVLALLLNRKVRGRAVFRTLIFSPYVTTTAAVALLWVWIFDPNYGLINWLLSWVGIAGPRWLTSTEWAMPAIILMSAWRTMGYSMVIFLAGLTAIPRDLYEAASIDGAGGWAALRYITIPLLSPTTFFLMVTSLIGALQEFDSVAVMTAGGPVDATKVFNYFIFEQAFVVFRAGYAAAVATSLFLVILVLTIVQLRLSRRWVHYQ